MTVPCAKRKITLPNTVIRDQSGSPTTSKMELFVTIIYNWKHSTTAGKGSILDGSRRLDPSIVNMILQLQ